MKKSAKISKNGLKRIISETIQNILESEFPILHGEGNGEVYRDDAFVTDWRDNPNDEPNKVKAPYNSYVWNKNFSKHYPTPESFWNPKDTRAYKYTKDLDNIHKEEDKFKKSEDLKTQRALDAADKRPLHRKGSLNRAMDENIKKSIKLTKNGLNNIISESVKRILKETTEVYDSDSFTINMNKLYNIVEDEVGCDSIRDCIAGWLFDFDEWDNESKVVPCSYSKSGIFNLLYTLCNYDLICIDENSVDIKNSNHPDIAKLISPYVNSQMCSKIYGHFMSIL